MDVTVVVSEMVAVAVSGTTSSVGSTVVVVVIVRVVCVSTTDDIAVAGKIVTTVVALWEVDCGMLKQEHAVEIAADANPARSFKVRQLAF